MRAGRRPRPAAGRPRCRTRHRAARRGCRRAPAPADSGSPRRRRFRRATGTGFPSNTAKMPARSARAIDRAKLFRRRRDDRRKGTRVPTAHWCHRSYCCAHRQMRTSWTSRSLHNRNRNSTSSFIATFAEESGHGARGPHRLATGSGSDGAVRVSLLRAVPASVEVGEVTACRQRFDRGLAAIGAQPLVARDEIGLRFVESARAHLGHPHHRACFVDAPLRRRGASAAAPSTHGETRSRRERCRRWLGRGRQGRQARVRHRRRPGREP